MRSLGLLHPTFERWGGAEWYIHQTLCAMLEGRLREAVVYTHRYSPPPGEKRLPYRVVEHRYGGLLSAPWDWSRVARRLAPSWREHDALLIHNYPATMWLAAARQQADLPPAVWYCHEPPEQLHGQHESAAERRSTSSTLSALRFYRLRAGWWLYSRWRERRERARLGERRWREARRAAEREAVAAIETILANSRFTADRVASIYGKSAEVVYPVPADLDRLAPSAAAEKDRTVLWVGRLTPAKRPLMMLDAWEQARRSEPELECYRLRLIGDGPLRSQIDGRIAALGGSIARDAALSRATLVEAYRRAVVTVHLGRQEPFGLVPLEAMAAGSAVIAAGEGGVRETVIVGETGWLLEPCERQTLAAALAKVPARHQDLCEMGRQAVASVRARFCFEDSLAAVCESLGSTRTAP
ncbi:MAG: glycosyltransferase family 4 protein [Acidobacteriota bacterium]|nr:MAG: glycosyltransferase family 4 protein [Acidobacteriota bacterium]